MQFLVPYQGYQINTSPIHKALHMNEKGSCINISYNSLLLM